MHESIFHLITWNAGTWQQWCIHHISKTSASTTLQLVPGVHPNQLCTWFMLCCVLLWFGTDPYYPNSSGLLHWHWDNLTITQVPNSGLLHWHWGNPRIAPMPVKQPLTHLPLEKMAAISQKTFSNTFLKSFVFRLEFHWGLFPRGQYVSIGSGNALVLKRWQAITNHIRSLRTHNKFKTHIAHPPPPSLPKKTTKNEIKNKLKKKNNNITTREQASHIKTMCKFSGIYCNPGTFCLVSCSYCISIIMESHQFITRQKVPLGNDECPPVGH